MSYSTSSPYTLVILGTGTIGQAFLSAYLSAPKPETQPVKIIACVRSESSAQKLASIYKSTSSITFETSYGPENNAKAVKEAAVVVLGTKPYVTQEALHSLSSHGANLEGKLLISLVAGWTIDQFSEYTAKVSRVMTNTPAKYQYGTAVVSNSPFVSDDESQLILDLVSPIGKVIVLPESNMDAATGLVGSGPAFLLAVLEGLIESGISLGIPYEQSKQCAVSVMEGTAKLVELSGTHPSELKHKICTPNGTTIAGLVELEKHGVKHGVIKAVQKASQRSSELAKK